MLRLIAHDLLIFCPVSANSDSFMNLLSGHLSGSITSSSHGLKADPSFHVVTCCFLFVSMSFHWLVSHLCPKVIISTLQKDFGLLVSCWFVPPADITGWLKFEGPQGPGLAKMQLLAVAQRRSHLSFPSDQ